MLHIKLSKLNSIFVDYLKNNRLRDGFYFSVTVLISRFLETHLLSLYHPEYEIASYYYYAFPTLLFGQQTTIKEIIKPYMYTQNYEHFKRLIIDSPNSEASYVDGFHFEWEYF